MKTEASAQDGRVTISFLWEGTDWMGKKRERTDPEKVFANWNKTLGLFERGEYSVAIVRAAVTMELAANIVVRTELVKSSPGRLR